jgi:hypothetical protein
VPPGGGKYLATYELDSLAVLSSPAYLARYENQSPWSRRCLGKALVFKRWLCEQLEPGRADPDPAAQALLLNAEATGALQTRRFAATNGERITLCELAEERARNPSFAIVYRRYQP